MKTLIYSNRSLPLDVAEGQLPERIHIVPRGELAHKAAGVTQVLDDKGLKSILADLQNRHAKNGGLYMGEEHFIYDPTKSSQAFAWGREFGLDAKGIWTTKYDPTDVGEPALKNCRFKFTSFAADPQTPGAVEKIGPGRVRVMKIDTVGFTNFPNGKGMLEPITNRDAPADGVCPDCGTKLKPGDKTSVCPDCGETFADASASAANQQKTNQGKIMKNIATKLGLTAEANEESILAVVGSLLNRADITVQDLTTLKNRKTELEAQNKTLMEEQIEGILTNCGVKKEDKRRPHLVSSLQVLKNREERLAHLADFGFVPVEEKTPEQQRLLNRNDGKDPKVGAGDENERAEKAEGEIETYRLTNRCSYESARNAVRRQKPELFGLKKN
jgi:hypothetical protein